MQRRTGGSHALGPTHHPFRQAIFHALLPIFAAIGAFVALSSAEPVHPSGTPDPIADPIDVAARGPAAAADAALAPSLPEPAPPPRAEPPPEPEPPPPAARDVTSGILKSGSTLATSLRAHGVSAQAIDLIARSMSRHFDFRNARPGHSYRLSRDEAGELVDFRYRTSETSSYVMSRDGDDWQVRREEAAMVPRTVRLAGVVSTTLYGAIVALGESGQLASDFADVFAWDIDFQRSVQPGDAFRIVYERLYRTESDGSEVYVRPGRILAASYEGTAGHHQAVYFEPSEGRGGYYRPDGSSVERSFLMAPLRHARVSSSYSQARRHPILKITRPHHGIDYAAPLGAPVWAVSDGEVIYRARAGGFGNLVKIKHSNGYVSYYAHLSRFAKGMRVGDRVEQKQVIGYVGQTGLATGPHVCFRVAKNGRYVNPARLRTPAGKPVPAELLPTFRNATALLLAELGGETRVAEGSL
jgi:murein DD-endopeptidase MepM/ murein hydrolase activator NlpD